MKKKLYALFLLIAALACTKKVDLPSDPDIEDGGRTSVSAAVAPYEAQAFVWPASARIGIYDAKGRSNCRYTIMNEFAGKGGEASFYGMSVSGPLVAYYPFSEKGYSCVAERRQPVLGEQVAGKSAAAHLALNAVLVAEASPEGKFEFSYSKACTGLLHLKVRASVEVMVEKLILQCPGSPLAGSVALNPGTEPLVADGSNTITLTQLGRPCSADSPLEVWAQVPAGNFSRLTVTVAGVGVAETATLASPVKVLAGGVTDVSVQTAPAESGNDDLLIIDGAYE